jgi:hypothetical protein
LEDPCNSACFKVLVGPSLRQSSGLPKSHLQRGHLPPQSLGIPRCNLPRVPHISQKPPTGALPSCRARPKDPYFSPPLAPSSAMASPRARRSRRCDLIICAEHRPADGCLYARHVDDGRVTA